VLTFERRRLQIKTAKCEAHLHEQRGFRGRSFRHLLHDRCIIAPFGSFWAFLVTGQQTADGTRTKSANVTSGDPKLQRVWLKKFSGSQSGTNKSFGGADSTRAVNLQLASKT
jgi:hypothetical protein